MTTMLTRRILAMTLSTIVPSARNALQRRMLQVSSVRPDLMEFFDDKKHWGEREVKVGRSWKVDELRLKSNQDLHKLWYILLKERNMLLTMEHDAKIEARSFPNPERIDKVQESMDHLEEVVRERNKAYFMLETGTTGERTGVEFENWLGLPEYRQHNEYPVPKEENREWHKAQEEVPKSSDLEKRIFYRMLRAAQRKRTRQETRKNMAEVYEALVNFPDVDLTYLKEKYPDITERKFNSMVAKVRSQSWENNEVPREEKVWKGQYVRKWYRTWRQMYPS